MPQMSPLNWFYLYLYLLMIIGLVNVLISFIFLKENKLYNKNFNNYSLNQFKLMW